MTTPKIRALQVAYDALVNGEVGTPRERLAVRIERQRHEEFREWLNGFDAVALSDIHYARCKGQSQDEIRREFEPRRRRGPATNDPGPQ